MNEYFIMLWGLLQGKLLALAILTALDFVFGVLVSLFIDKDFKWEYLSHYLLTDILPIFAWIGVVILSTLPVEVIPPGGSIPIAADLVYATVFLSILASALGAFASIGILKRPLERLGLGPDRSSDTTLQQLVEQGKCYQDNTWTPK